MWSRARRENKACFPLLHAWPEQNSFVGAILLIEDGVRSVRESWSDACSRSASFGAFGMAARRGAGFG